MSDLENTLVVVPARGGSKRIPRKNIKPIGGRPMIAWPLQVLCENFHTSQIIVSTDDPEITQISQQCGVSTPFRRPPELSGDFTGTMEVATHALSWFEGNVRPVDYVLIVYPTAILLHSADISSAYELLVADPQCTTVFAATEFAYPIQRAVYTDERNYVHMFQPEHYKSRTQDLTRAFHDAGQFYLCRSASVRAGDNLISPSAKIVKLPRYRVVDIDTEEDFEIAQRTLQALQSGQPG